MTSVNSDLASLLSQYRVMIYHNLETGRDEGLVFVKQGEDISTGELVRWTGDDPVVPGGTSTTSPSTSTPVSSPCSSPGQSSSSNNSTVIASPTTSQESSKPPTLSQDKLTMTISRSPSPSREESQPVNQTFPLTSPDQVYTKQSGPNGEVLPTHQMYLQVKSADKHKKKHSSTQSRIKQFSKPSMNLNNNSNLASLSVSQKEPALPEVYPKLNKEVEDNFVSSDSASSNTVKDKRVHSFSKVHKSLEMFKVSGEAGWVREVVRGDRKFSTPDKLRIAYLPPTSIRHIKTRLYSKTKLQAFLCTHCPNTTLTQDNFSFSACVLGLDMPWEVVRPAHLTLEQVMAGQTIAEDNNKTSKLVLSATPPASCLHCWQQLPPAESDAALHVRQCLHSKNDRMKTMLDCGDYSPLQHARPVKYKQRMPGMMATKPESESTPAKTTTQPGRQGMLDKTATQPGGQSMPDKTATQPDREGMLDKTASQPGRLDMPNKTASQPGGQSMPDKTASQPGGQSMLDKTATQPGRHGMLVKTASQPGRQGKPDKRATDPCWQGKEPGMKIDHHLGRQGMLNKTVAQPLDSHSSTSLSLNSLPDCISVSKLRL